METCKNCKASRPLHEVERNPKKALNILCSVKGRVEPVRNFKIIEGRERLVDFPAPKRCFR
jgi:hypothetical protein